MKKWCLVYSDNLLFGLFLFMALIISGTYFTENLFVLQLVLLLAIPLLVSFCFLKQKQLGVPIASFLLFAFLGNVFSVILQETNYVGISNIMYLAALVSLVFALVTEFKGQVQIRNKWLMVYLLAMFAIGLCFLVEISYVFSALVPNDVEFYVFVFQGLSLLVLGFLSFGVYLNKQTQSAIRFLVAVVCFGFALALNYVSAFYLFDFSFILLSHVFYICGLYCMFKFLLGEDKRKTKKHIEDCDVLYSEIVFA